VNQYVTDTHPILWHILSDTRLSPAAQAIFRETDAGVHQILIPSVVLVEVVYLAEKKRIPSKAVDLLFSLLGLAPANYVVIPLDIEVVQTLRAVSRTKVPDMPDRIIVATAKHMEAVLITKDTTIGAAGTVPVMW